MNKNKSGLSARRRGHTFERDIVKLLKELGYSATTSRYSSRELDDAKVDIDTDAPFNIQAKYVERMSTSEPTRVLLFLYRLKILLNLSNTPPRPPLVQGGITINKMFFVYLSVCAVRLFVVCV